MPREVEGPRQLLFPGNLPVHAHEALCSAQVRNRPNPDICVTFFCPLSQLGAVFMALPTGWNPFPTISMLCPGPYIAVVVAETGVVELNV